MRSIPKEAIWLAGLSLFPGVLLAEDDPRTFMLAASCAACHGIDGKSSGSTIPEIHGKSAKLIELSLQEYKSGESASTIMGRLAKGYTDEEIKLIAKYYATRP